MKDTPRVLLFNNSLELKILPLMLFCPNLNIIIYYFKLVYGTGIIRRLKRIITRAFSGIKAEVWSSFFWENKPRNVLLSENLATGLCLPWSEIKHHFVKSQFHHNDHVVPSNNKEAWISRRWFYSVLCPKFFQQTVALQPDSEVLCTCIICTFRHVGL